MKRQMAEEVKEKYYLLNRIKELSDEVNKLKEKVKKMQESS
jgi:predicted nuclease with TOPRIM domain